MSADGTVDNRLGEVMSDIQMPLENLAFTIEEYLLAHGPRLDTETRFLLAGVRDCADRVAGSVRQVARQSANSAARHGAEARSVATA
ncbi:MAG TPA: hypothetical protein VFJ13_00810 [Paracoccaceae bacterium]|nr:hypothetical protein [Paracoccaceae bacterium]